MLGVTSQREEDQGVWSQTFSEMEHCDLLQVTMLIMGPLIFFCVDGRWGEIQYVLSMHEHTTAIL